MDFKSQPSFDGQIICNTVKIKRAHGAAPLADRLGCHLGQMAAQRSRADVAADTWASYLLATFGLSSSKLPPK
jgi:hypothetical protein